MTQNSKVELFVYNIKGSGGYFKHTSVVVYGHEFSYFKRNGSVITDPQKTPCGDPIDRIQIGETNLTELEVYEAWQKMNDDYRTETYNLKENNCNHFTNAFTVALCGKPIPKDFLNQNFESIEDIAFDVSSFSLSDLLFVKKMKFFFSSLKGPPNNEANSDSPSRPGECLIM